MKAVVQRVRNASVKAEGSITGSIDWGLLVYLGVSTDDNEKAAEWIAEKVINLRIFEDAEGKMNLSIFDIIKQAGEGRLTEKKSIGVLAISQFTLLGDAIKGRRPYFGAAADPVKAKSLYELFIAEVKDAGLICEAGVFQAHMDITYTNDGPVTILLDSPLHK